MLPLSKIGGGGAQADASEDNLFWLSWSWWYFLGDGHDEEWGWSCLVNKSWLNPSTKSDPTHPDDENETDQIQLRWSKQQRRRPHRSREERSW